MNGKDIGIIFMTIVVSIAWMTVISIGMIWNKIRYGKWTREE